VPAGSDAPAAEAEVPVEVPPDAIGYVVEEVGVELPTDLAPGQVRIRVEASGAGDQRVAVARTVEVAGAPRPLRRLVGRDVVLTALASGRPLFDAGDVDREDAVVASLVQELRDAAGAAEETLPVVEEGRFAGLSGGTLFETSDAQDVRDFLAFLVADGVGEARLTFVDAYAQWALEGAPAP
jgi:hypothetical protein